MAPPYWERVLFLWVKSMVDPLLVSGLLSTSLASIVAGLMGVLVGYTKTQFLAIESLHMIIAASLVGGLVSWHYAAVPSDLISMITMALFVLIAALMLEKGFSQDTSMGFTVVVASMVASMSSYYVALSIPGGVSYVYTVLFGNPFLVPLSSISTYLLAGFFFVTMVLLLWRLFIYMAFDPETFEILRGGAKIYRWVLYMLIAFSAIYITRLIGAIPAHIALMMPGLVASRARQGSGYVAMALSISSSIASAVLSYQTGIPYGAMLGIISIALYLSILTRW